MNPGKVVDPYPHRREPAPRRRLPAAGSRRRTSQFPADDGSFAHATLRCVGIGNCRQHARAA